MLEDSASDLGGPRNPLSPEPKRAFGSGIPRHVNQHWAVAAAKFAGKAVLGGGIVLVIALAVAKIMKLHP